MKTKDFKQKIKKVKSKILDLIYPKNIKCEFCNQELNERAHNNTCCSCFNSLPFISNPCSKCGTELKTNTKGICLKCSKYNRGFDLARAVFSYEGMPKNLVQQIKYLNKPQRIEFVVNYLIDAYKYYSLKADIVTFVPMFISKEMKRGFNQAKLMAQLFAEKMNLKFMSTCEKVVDSASQTDLNTQERMNNVKGSFEILRDIKTDIKNKTILIIDDVVTTGATTSEISSILKQNGAKACVVLTFAHTRIDGD